MDDNFGNETAEDLYTSIKDDIVGSWFSCPKSGQADSITARLKLDNTGFLAKTFHVKCAIYDKSDGSRVGYTVEWSKTVGGLDTWIGWHTFSIISDGSLNIKDYYLCAWAKETGAYIAYKTEATKGAHDIVVYDGFPDPWTPEGFSVKCSIYCTYTPIVPPPAKPLINKPLVNPILVNVPIIR